MNTLVSINATINETPKGKIIWEYAITEKMFGGDETITQKSTVEFDTQEEAAAHMLTILNYVLAGKV